MNEVMEGAVVRETDPAAQPVAVAPTPMAMLAEAVRQGADPEKLDRLLALQERWEANEARKAFAAAFVRFKAEAVSIIKNKHVSFKTDRGVTEYNHSTLDAVCDTVIPILQRFGFAHHWKPETTDGKVAVTCILMHEQGHETSVTMAGVPDTSGGKNAIQGIASTTSYFERYTFLAVCGLATKGQDDDGKGAGTTGMPESELADHETAIEGAIDAESLEKAWSTAAAACEKHKDVPAYASLKLKTTERAKALRKK